MAGRFLGSKMPQRWRAMKAGELFATLKSVCSGRVQPLQICRDSPTRSGMDLVPLHE